MINFDFNRYCYGCGNCSNVCPTSAITMKENGEGFLMPHIEEEKCIQCGLCNQKCIYLNEYQEEKSSDLACYACYGYTNTELLKKSASGGVFPALAKYILSRSGYICGCIWDDEMKAKHIVTNEWKMVSRMLHSKYTQSDMGNCLKEVKDLLTQNAPILFTGTPCQIAAIILYTGNPPNLYTCDLICKGVPSPGVWRHYKEYIEEEQKSKLKNVILRSKHKYGWTGPVTKYEFIDGSKREDLFFQLNHFIVGFLDGLYMRNSCYHCQYKDDSHQADIVLGDFWGINRRAFKASGNLGVSAVITRNEKGAVLWNQIKSDFEWEEVTYQEMVNRNTSMTKSTPVNPKRNQFYENYPHMNVAENISMHTDLNGWKKKIIRFTVKFHVFGWYKKMKEIFYK